MRRHYERLCKVEIESVQRALQAGQEMFYVPHGKGHHVDLTSARIRTYTDSTTCVYCGQTAAFFAVERDGNTVRGKGDNEYIRYHLNLYGYGPQGNEVMITSDHIVPRSTGGSDGVSNRQPCCEKCNSEKSNYADVLTARWERALELVRMIPFALRRGQIVRIFSEEVTEVPTFDIIEQNGYNALTVEWRGSPRVVYSQDPESPDHITSRQLRSRLSVERNKQLKKRLKRERMEAL